MQRLILVMACTLMLVTDTRADLIFFTDSTYFRGKITVETETSVTGIEPDGKNHTFMKNGIYDIQRSPMMRSNNECRIKILFDGRVIVLKNGMKLGDFGESLIKEIQRLVNSNSEGEFTKEEVRSYVFEGLKQKEGDWDLIKDVLKGLIVLDGAEDFNEGYAPFFTAGKWGFVDSLGNVCVDAVYDSVRVFTGGIAAVKHEVSWGAINSEGDVVVSFDFLSLYFFNEGVMPFEILNPLTGNNILGFVTENDAICLEYINGSGEYSNLTGLMMGVAGLKINGREGLIDINGNYILEPVYSYIIPVMDGVLKAVKDTDNTSTFIDSAGNVLFKKEYDYVKYTNDINVAIARFGSGENVSQWTLFDKSGKELIQPSEDEIEGFNEGAILFKKDVNGKGRAYAYYYGMLETDGSLKYSEKYVSAGVFSNGLALVNINADCVYIDKNFEFVFSRSCDEGADFTGGFARVIKNSRTVFINVFGEIIFGNL